MLCEGSKGADNLPDVAAHFHIQENIIENVGRQWGGSSRAARFARGAAASRQRARQRLATDNRLNNINFLICCLLSKVVWPKFT